jgi:hypothetical protein
MNGVGSVTEIAVTGSTFRHLERRAECSLRRAVAASATNLKPIAVFANGRLKPKVAVDVSATSDYSGLRLK